MIKILDFDCLEFLPGGLSSYELTPLDVFQIKSDQCLFSPSKAELTPLDVFQIKSGWQSSGPGGESYRNRGLASNK